MQLNLFFILILALLLGMFTYFSPKYAGVQTTQEIPKIELKDFVLYEVSSAGTLHILEGAEGKKFEDRYTLTSAKFSDNTRPLLQSVSASDVIYKGEIIDLRGNVHYVREDGLEFRSREGRYDTKRSLVQTRGAFTITQNSNRIDGNQLNLNNELDTVSANRIRVSYQLK